MYIELGQIQSSGYLPTTQLPTFEYPIRSPQEILSLFPNGKVPIFGYGSLLNPASAARHLSQDALNSSRLTIAFGLRRVFDRAVGGPTHWGVPEKPNDTGMLNVQLTGQPDDLVNGVVMELDEADLLSVISREKGYDLVPVPVIYWDEAEYLSPQVFYAYTFRASTEAREGIVYTSPSVNPIPGYALASKEGAELYGQSFLEFWLATTFLADGETPFAEWEQNPNLDLGIC